MVVSNGFHIHFEDIVDSFWSYEHYQKIFFNSEVWISEPTFGITIRQDNVNDTKSKSPANNSPWNPGFLKKIPILFVGYLWIIK